MRINQILHYRATPSHGYFSISPKLNSNVPDKYRKTSYEEDCEYAIPLFFNFSLMSVLSEKKHVIRSIRNYFPEIYLSAGKKLRKGDSFLYDEAVAHRDNKGCYFLKGAWGDWAYDVPKDKVYVILSMSDGSFNLSYSKTFTKTVSCLVTQEEYQKLFKHETVDDDFVSARIYSKKEEFYTWEDYTRKTGKPRYK